MRLVAAVRPPEEEDEEIGSDSMDSVTGPRFESHESGGQLGLRALFLKTSSEGVAKAVYASDLGHTPGSAPRLESVSEALSDTYHVYTLQLLWMIYIDIVSI